MSEQEIRKDERQKVLDDIDYWISYMVDTTEVYDINGNLTNSVVVQKDLLGYLQQLKDK